LKVTQQLTQAQLNTLGQFAAQGDRLGYWNYLSSLGDRYAGLAGQVVTGETVSGYVANTYFQRVVTDQMGRPLTGPEMWDLGVNLMNRDLAARQVAVDQGGTGLNLPVETIANYHDQAFRQATNGAVGYEGWTAWAPIRVSIEQGNNAHAEFLWSLMLDQGFVNNILVTGAVTGVAPNDANAQRWLDVVPGAAAESANLPSHLNSLKNTEVIDGWYRDPVTGKWWRPNPEFSDGEVGGLSGLYSPYQDATTEQNARLDSERAFRIQTWGNEAISNSSLFGFLSSDENFYYRLEGDASGIRRIEITPIANDGTNDGDTDLLVASYDDNGLIEAINQYYDNGYHQRTDFSNGAQTRVTAYGPDGRPDWEVDLLEEGGWHSILFDDLGTVTRTTAYGADGVVDWATGIDTASGCWWDATYDAGGFLDISNAWSAASVHEAWFDYAADGGYSYIVYLDGVTADHMGAVGANGYVDWVVDYTGSGDWTTTWFDDFGQRDIAYSYDGGELISARDWGTYGAWTDFAYGPGYTLEAAFYYNSWQKLYFYTDHVPGYGWTDMSFDAMVSTTWSIPMTSTATTRFTRTGTRTDRTSTPIISRGARAMRSPITTVAVNSSISTITSRTDGPITSPGPTPGNCSRALISGRTAVSTATMPATGSIRTSAITAITCRTASHRTIRSSPIPPPAITAWARPSAWPRCSAGS
jgi:hypothetical protein